MNLKILFYEMVSNSQIFVCVKSYVSVPLPKMKIFIKKKKKNWSNCCNIKMWDKNCLRNSKDWVKKIIQILDIIAQQILTLGLKMIK